jgi:hypothetical protein
MDGITTCGICSKKYRYLREKQQFDSLNIARINKKKKRVATLSIDRNLAPANEFHYYEKYMQSCGIYDVLDFLFWDGPRAIAGLGVIKTKNDPPITTETIRVARSIQPLLESKLQSHPKLSGNVCSDAAEDGDLKEQVDVANPHRGGLPIVKLAKSLTLPRHVKLISGTHQKPAKQSQ